VENFKFKTKYTEMAGKTLSRVLAKHTKIRKSKKKKKTIKTSDYILVGIHAR
jgi:hypothetical protein